ncbi:MAG: hypothetical protein ACRD5E_04580 [Nitrososphaeraceae archaeon]
MNTFAYDITNAKVQSNLFGIEVPEDNILCISAQNILGIAAGDWVFSKPSVFVPGIHKISFTGEIKWNFVRCLIP